MGTKTIWDGQGLPEKGDEVLILLARSNAWVRHVVTGIDVKPNQGELNNSYQVNITLDKSRDPRSSANSRPLYLVKPLDWREGE